MGHWWLGLCRPRLHSLTDSDAAHSQRDHREGAGPTAGSRRNLANDSEGSHSTPRRADQVGMPRLPIFEPFGLSSRSCCSTGRLMRSWFIDGNLADLRLSFFPPRSLPERAMASVRPGWGGPGPRGRSTTNGPRPRDPGRKFANKIYLQRDSWRVVFPSCKKNVILDCEDVHIQSCRFAYSIL